MTLKLKVVERRRQENESNRINERIDSRPPRDLLGQWHKAAIAMYDMRRGSESASFEVDNAVHDILEMPLEDDESIIAMNKRLIQERNALMQQKELWQAELQEQHDSLQDVLRATRQLKLKLQAQANEPMNTAK
ncbi:hypothetical protein THRCLA_20713 [Thraustotheca clavata]|uniref:Uncharacterized protein n=1 Tax=Thraustotheca clavata TaxID=74557 RepID=A0A1W0A523_9STRA|nr:hypothetical protein THRCLA_20713 [Thraustotheca clavata]